MKITRRGFIQTTGVAAAAGMFGMPYVALGASKKVVIVGGGTGGATAAKYLRMADPTVEVTLIEANEKYICCYLSNEVLSGERTLDSLTVGYAGLAKHGVNLVHDTVTEIDPKGKTVKTAGGKSFGYDRCIVAPGVEMKWGALEGYDEKASETIPHAWKAGPQTTMLKKQIDAMNDGGVVVITAPGNPYRCPPGPYERASQIAMYLKANKPKSKVIILDAKDKFAKQGLFVGAWKKLYGYETENSMISWQGSDKEATPVKVDVATKTVTTKFGDEIKADVLNVIPPQQAGKIAQLAGLANESGWCPVNMKTFESKIHAGIHVIGDAAVATEMPKSAYSANSQAKVCATAVLAMLEGKEPGVPAYVNTCYSIVGHDYGFSVAGVYRMAEDGSKIVQVSGGVTAADASPETLAREVKYAHSWFANIVADSFG